MKHHTSFTAIVSGLALLSLSATAADLDLVAKLQGIAPSQSVDWNAAGGVEAQAQFWATPTRGVALTMGVQRWDAPQELLEGEDAQGAYSQWIGGDATIVPVGASLLVRHPVGQGLFLTAEAGLRYVMVESQLTVDASFEGDEGTQTLSDVIEIEDTVLGVLGLSLDGWFGDGLMLGAGLSYQFDIGNPQETINGADIGSTGFGGLSVALSVGFAF